ncbi:MAG: phosphoribosylformylglycinamidine synthase subunit PurQ [Chloroflexi bacterium]|nr:phosphoribosylformylglycinamidine synthase subunit PurQ [Chloroflexota bacterium]
MRFGVVVFPGSNCERDTLHVLTDVLRQPADLISHESTDLSGYDCVILPGGFAHGDYLRAGAIARFSPVMRAVERLAADGRLVWGICNGFQVLVEAGLLPGAMLQNAGLRFVCRWVHVRVDADDTPYTHSTSSGAVLRMPIAHHEGSYFVSPDQLARLEQRRQIVLRYCDADGAATPSANPNGSISSIAGVCNEARNVFGLMPHPERCAEPILGGVDGRLLFESVLSRTSERHAATDGDSRPRALSAAPGTGVAGG